MPLNPIFRVGQLGLGYDEDEDMVVIVAQSFAPELDVDADMEAEDDEWGETALDDAPDESETLLARFYATRNQMRTFSEHALQVVQAGRPDCPLCGRPIDPHGHFCPRTDGHAFPLMV